MKRKILALFFTIISVSGYSQIKNEGHEHVVGKVVEKNKFGELEVLPGVIIKSLKNNNYLILEFKIHNFISCTSNNGL